MKLITIQLTADELRLLIGLAADQLFRKEFIDRKLPGYKNDGDQLSLGKALVGRLRPMVDAGSAKRTAPAKENGTNAEV
jgi:hypothetical protein